MKVKLLSRVRLLVTPWTEAYQAPPSMGFSRQVLEWGAIAFSGFQVQIYLIMFQFIALCRHYILYKWKVCGNPPSSKSTSNIFPITLAHFMSLCVRKIPWRRDWQPTPVLLSEKSCGQRSLTGYSSWGHKELDMTEPRHPDVTF